MAFNPKFSTGLRNGMMNGTVDLSTAFDTDAILQMYDGAKPGSADDAPVGTLLVEIAVDANSFQPVSGGVLALNGIWQDVSANAPGTITWFRLKKSDVNDPNGLDVTAIRVDGEVGITGSGSDIEITSPTVAAGDQVTVDAFTITLA